MIFLVSDFSYEEISGGAEYVDQFFLNSIEGLTFIKSHDFTEEEFSSKNQYIISNFTQLSEKTKTRLIESGNYIIVEHDYKFVRERNPIKYPNFKVPFDLRINALFYNTAKAVFAQSDYHAQILKRNLPFSNIISFNGTFYKQEHLDLLQKISKERTVKNGKYAVIGSNHISKGKHKTEQFCKKNNIEYEIIRHMDYEKFLLKLSEYTGLVFLPQTPETFCRLIYEAKVLGLKVKTNKNSGIIHEKWIKDTPESLINYIKVKQQQNLTLLLKILNTEKQENFVLTEIISMYKSEKFIGSFLENLCKQSLFNHTKILLINCDSPSFDKEREIIEPYLNKHKNIELISLDSDPGIYGAWNEGIKRAVTKFVCNSNTDDMRFVNATEEMIDILNNNPKDCLIYGDSRVMREYGVLTTERSEHSTYEFSRENMIKCLPGPNPIWRLTLHEKYGLFDKKCKYAGDWEYWLRIVEGGETFYKIKKDIGACYFNPAGLTTSKTKQAEKHEEESKIFYQYKDIFGEENYKNYKGYFIK